MTQHPKPVDSSFVEISRMIAEARKNVFRSVNKELITLYWNVGEYIGKKVANEAWGKAIIENLARYLRREHPDLRGFSPQNMWRMKQFYECYKDSPILSTLSRELSWSNNVHILSKTKSIEEKEFYLRLCMKERYSVRELERQIDSGYYERYMLSAPKLSPLVREMYPQAEEIFRDRYVLEFLDLPESHSESDLKKGIIQNLKRFILEFGRDFSFIGEEYRLQVGNNDSYVDLLFFHRELRCLVAFERR